MGGKPRFGKVYLMRLLIYFYSILGLVLSLVLLIKVEYILII